MKLRHIFLTAFASIALLSVGNPLYAQSGKTKNNKLSARVKTFKVGAAVNTKRMKEDGAYLNLVKKEFNQITATAEMKMAQIWTADGAYNFENVDYLLNYAQQNKTAVFGHTLLWYKSFPQWFKDAKYDSVTFENKVKEYITTVVGRYKGKIRAWDVANEIFKDDGTLRKESQIQGTFKDPVGFVGRCFRYAHAADPKAKLFYNDYSTVIHTSKRNAIKRMVSRFKKEGIPIDGLGDQYHYSINTSQDTITKGFKDLASTGLLIHISEMDCKINVKDNPEYVITQSDLRKQYDFFKTNVMLYNSLPLKQKFAITVWGVTDKYTWRKTEANKSKEYPLLFDENYLKKPAYNGFVEALK